MVQGHSRKGGVPHLRRRRLVWHDKILQTSAPILAPKPPGGFDRPWHAPTMVLGRIAWRYGTADVEENIDQEKNFREALRMNGVFERAENDSHPKNRITTRQYWMGRSSKHRQASLNRWKSRMTVVKTRNLKVDKRETTYLCLRPIMRQAMMRRTKSFDGILCEVLTHLELIIASRALGLNNDR